MKDFKLFEKEEKGKHLYRKDFIELVDSDKIWSKTMSMSEIKELLDILENEILKCSFDIDNNFVMNSRRKGLKENIVNRLSKSDIKNEDILESLFNFWEFVQDEYSGTFTSICEELGLTVQELTIMDENYRNNGIICEQEKQVILNIISILKKSIDW